MSNDELYAGMVIAINQNINNAVSMIKNVSNEETANEEMEYLVKESNDICDSAKELILSVPEEIAKEVSYQAHDLMMWRIQMTLEEYDIHTRLHYCKSGLMKMFNNNNISQAFTNLANSSFFHDIMDLIAS